MPSVFWAQPLAVQAVVVIVLLWGILRIRFIVLSRLHKATHAPNHGDWALGFYFLYQTMKEAKIGNYQEFLRKRMKRLGLSTAAFRLAGNNVVITHDPDNIKAMLSTQFNDFSLGPRNKCWHVTLGDGIFTLDGSGWKHSRAMLRPQFTREQVGHLESLEKSSKILINLISELNGAPFDIQPLFYKLTLDNGTDFLFGQSCNSLGESGGCDNQPSNSNISPDIRNNFAEAFDYVQRILFLRLNLQGLYWLAYTKEFERCNKIVHEFTNFYVNQALQLSDPCNQNSSSERYVFLNELIKETRDPKALRDQCLNVFLAARDTTAGLLSFTFYSLAKNPRVFDKLRQVIIEAFGEGNSVELSSITFESLKRCEYLKWVISEVLRMYPSVPRNVRVATKNTTLPRGGGPDQSEPVFIERGTPVFYLVYSLHRDNTYYGSDAHLFRPERWGESMAKQAGWAYLPFNGGPRVCLGQQLALTTASYVTVRLLQSFSGIESLDSSYPPRLNKHLTMSLMDGANITLKSHQLTDKSPGR